MPKSLPSDPVAVRRIVDAWIADQTETLDTDARAKLNDTDPHWRDDAAQLIAEGLLAYVIIEMVTPDLAIAGAQAGHGHYQFDGAELTARLAAHLQDFIDYRAELIERAELSLAPGCRDQH